MNYHIVYIAIYRALECLEQESGKQAISAYLDDANPYVFKDRVSADPIVFNDYMEWVENRNLDNMSSFDIAKKYVDENTDFPGALSDIDEEEWDDLIEIIKSEESWMMDMQ